MAIELVKVESKKQRDAFIDFPHDLYASDQHYVPELYLAMKEHLDPAKNPFFQTSEAHLYLAYSDGKIVGRIAAILNNNYNKFHSSNVAFFGFFDIIDDIDVSRTLLQKVEEFAKSKKVEKLLGPTNFNTNDTAGLLVDGFDSPPVIQMTYNYPYYQNHIESYGFTKDMDLFAYWIPTSTVNEKSLQLAERIKERLSKRGITFRNISKKNFAQEVKNVKEIYRSAWENNWGFFPPTDAEFDFLAEGLKLMVDERYAYVCEDNGKMIAFAVALPDINEIVKGFKKGRLFPFNIIKLLLGKKKTKKVRVVLLGVKSEYRKNGIEAVFYSDFITAAKKNGLEGGEASWILESNEAMNKGAENLNGHKYKTYRIYTKTI